MDECVCNVQLPQLTLLQARDLPVFIFQERQELAIVYTGRNIVRFLVHTDGEPTLHSHVQN